MLGRTNTGGGGLNFKVVGNPQPTSASENTIWIDTDAKITSYIFGTTEPQSPADGMVWITTGIFSPVEFNALKKNGIQVYPQYAKQYVGSAWVDKVAKIWQDGEWVKLWSGVLYEAGNEFEAYTGGWSSNGWTITGTTGNVYKSADGTKGEDYLQIQYSSNSTCYMLGTQNKIDFTGYSTLEVECERISGAEMYVVTPQEKLVAVTKTTPSVAMSKSGIATLDISTVGSAYIALVPRLNGSEIPKWKITKVRLLK